MPVQEFHDLHSRLRSSINCQKLFEEESECEQYILQNTTKADQISLVIEDTISCHEFLSHIHPLRQVCFIYLLRLGTQNETSRKLCCEQFTKIVGIFGHIDQLIISLQNDQVQRKIYHSIHTSFELSTVFPGDGINTDRSATDINAMFLHSSLILDVLLRMKRTRSDSNMELIDILKDVYADNEVEIRKIERFAATYVRNDAILWYTADSFVYRVLNKAFRVNNTYVLYLFRSFIFDLHAQLKELQCKSILRVYRGQLMTPDEFKHLRRSIGQFISINSFLSTTDDRNVAVFYLGQSVNSSESLQRTLFEIDADPTIEGVKPFSKIATFSSFPNEHEVLFMARSIFQIIEILREPSVNMFIVRMVLCGDEQNNLKAMYEQNRNDYGGGRQQKTSLMTLGNVLQRIGKLNDAEIFYRRELNALSVDDDDSRSLSACYFNMGEIARERGEYESSMLWYQKSVDIDTKILGDAHANIGNTYNSIGIVHEKTGDYEAALDAYSTALNIALQTFGWNNTRVALCLNNTGNAYQALGNYAEALNCHYIALTIRRKNLPSNHHRLAASHNNIGVVYHRAGYFDIALERYKAALEIDRQTLPTAHPDITLIMHNIGLLHESRGNLQLALINFEQTVKHWRSPQDNNVGFAEIQEDIERIKTKLV